VQCGSYFAVHAGIVSYTRLRALGPAKWSQKGYPSNLFDFFSAFSVRVDTALRCERRAATLATVVGILLGGLFIASSLDAFATQIYLDHAYSTGQSICHTEFEPLGNCLPHREVGDEWLMVPTSSADAVVLACSLQITLEHCSDTVILRA